MPAVQRSAMPAFAPHSPQVIVVCQHARGEPRVRIFNDIVASLADAGRSRARGRARAPARARARARAPHPRTLKTHVRAHSPALPAWARGLGDSPSLLRCQLHCGGCE
jgi:hypothetical protein